jgi:hypothetical protein
LCGLGWCCVVQHPPVYTVGKRATFHNIKASTEVRKTTADSRPEPEPSAQIVHYVVPGDSPAWHLQGHHATGDPVGTAAERAADAHRILLRESAGHEAARLSVTRRRW